MQLRKAQPTDLSTVHLITHATIAAIYPHYYPEGAVQFFLAHHSEALIAEDIQLGRVWLCLDDGGNAVGTMTLKGNEICRLFVLPACQGQGYGSAMLDFAEAELTRSHVQARLDASLPGKRLYLKRGYQVESFHIIPTEQGDFLCYEVMTKTL